MRRIKSDNRGSTLILAMLTIVFVAILGSVLLLASSANQAMKEIDNASKNTFYTAESVIDEIKAGVGQDTMYAMGTAYESILTNLIRESGGLSVMVDNEVANQEFKENYMNNVIKILFEEHAVTYDTVSDKLDINDDTRLDKVKEYIATFVSTNNRAYAEISDIGSILIVKNYNGIKDTVMIKDVVVKYKAKKNKEEFFADVTVDLDIAFPMVEVDFSGVDRLTEFKDYAFIADGNINVSGATANVHANIFAGNNISIKANDTDVATLNAEAKADAEGNLEAVNVVAGGDIVTMSSSSNKATLNAIMSDLWCVNLTAARLDGAKGSVIKIDSDSNTYVEDDLNVAGDYSEVTIGGNYYGYRYDGASVTEGSGQHLTSSAIIVNGTASTLNLGSNDVTLKKLVVGGHSFINYKNSSVFNYMTGESLSFTGNQEIYLIPSKYVGVGMKKNVSNPMPKDVWVNLQNTAATDEEVKIVDMDDSFFVIAENLLVDHDEEAGKYQYVVKEIDNLVYLYYNFKSKRAAAQFMEGVVAGKDAELKSILNKYTGKLLTDGENTGSINISNTGSVYTSGVLLKTSGTGAGLNVQNETVDSSEINSGDYEYAGTSVITSDVFALTSIDLQNRYSILKHLLVDLPSEKSVAGVSKPYIVNDVESALWEMMDGYEMLSSEMDKTAAENVVDFTAVESNGYNDGSTTEVLRGTSWDSYNITKVAINDSYELPSHIKAGIIISTGNVTVDHDFKGLIIAKGDIVVNNDANITTDVDMVESLITYEYEYKDGGDAEDTIFRNYFHAYKNSASSEGSDESIKIESLDADDLISINNWRKYDDSES